MKIREILSENAVPEVELTKATSDFVPPTKTIKAYKLFRVDQRHPGKLFPLFVKADQSIEIGKWYEAEIGEMSGDKVKSKIGKLAFRPGWHAGDSPLATHIGDFTDQQKKQKADAERARLMDLKDQMSDPEFLKVYQNSDKTTQKNMVADLKKKINAKHPYPKGTTTPSIRPSTQVWAEVEMPADVDWQSEADKRGINAKGKFIAKAAHITDQLPKGGHYRYKTNTNMTGNWIIGGAMKVTRVLSDDEVVKLNKKVGASDLPRTTPFDNKKYGF
jgi:hypothetical protein